MRSGLLARTSSLLFPTFKLFSSIYLFFRACRSVDTIVRVWHRSTLKLHCLLEGHEGSVNAIGLQAGQIVSASEDGKMILWDIESGERIWTFDGHEGELTCVDFKVCLPSISLFLLKSNSFDGCFYMFRGI